LRIRVYGHDAVTVTALVIGRHYPLDEVDSILLRSALKNVAVGGLGDLLHRE
jgi:hypothetical protein